MAKTHGFERVGRAHTLLALFACAFAACNADVPGERSMPHAGSLAPSAAGAAALGAGAKAPPSAGAGGTAASAANPTPPAGGASANNSGSSGSAGAATVTPLPGTGAGLKLSITVPGVAPGQEGTQCVQARLSNSAPVNIVKIHNTLSPASHHFIVTALSDPAAPEQPLQNCKAFRGALAGAPLTITQKHDDTVQLPDGVGYRLLASQTMNLELHYLNPSDKTVDVMGTTELFPAAPGATLQEGAVLLVGTTDIDIPARTMKQNMPKYLALPAGMDGVKFYAITGHTHRFGTNVTVSSAAASKMPMTQLYAPDHFDWEAPEMKTLMPHATIPSGGGFLLQCAWNNTSDAQVKFGESANAEMCFFWGYYYPKKQVQNVVLDNLNASVIKGL